MGPPPKSIVPRKYPVTTTAPVPSTATAEPTSSIVPPKRFDQTCAPSAAAYFAITMSCVPDAWSAAPPNAAVPENRPVATTSPLGATATLIGASSSVPPQLRAQTRPPVGEYFARNQSVPPALTSVLPPTSTLPRNMPATTTLPFASTATSFVASAVATPMRRAHWVGVTAVTVTATVSLAV